ncbi:MAG TPA: pyruvate kinase, partial [Paraburkholderia sp.]|uniref:pyruvate kinase n=1 Tax=Paraburkholderia sp. TaxID=1926495 RepID=UPI002B4969D0
MKAIANMLGDSSTQKNGSRRAKIICTIGPSCATEAAMRDLLRLGMDIARLNFSHGTHEDHAHNIQRLRRA